MPKTVTVYSTPYCPWCKKAKEFLTKNKIAFTDHDVANDKMAKETMLALTNGVNAVPVIVVDGRVVMGYDEIELKTLLGL